MGMDCYGVNNDKAYFRANVWSWHPLWTACHHIAPHIINDEAHKKGSANGGFEITALQCSQLAKVLTVAWETGFLEWYEAEFLSDEDTGMMADRAHWDEFITFLGACGGFRIH